MIPLNYSLHIARLLKFSDNFLFQLCVRVEVSEEECGSVGGRRGQLEKQTFEVQKAAPFCCAPRDQRRGNFSFSIKKPVSSAVSSTSICFFGCSPFSLKRRAVRNQALSTDSSHHLTSPRPRIQRPGCCKFLRVCYISPQQWCLPNINGMLRKWSVFAKLKNTQCTAEGCHLVLALTKGPSQA